MSRDRVTTRILGEIGAGLRRAVHANDRLAQTSPGQRVESRLDAFCRNNPDTVRETVEELARMRAGWQGITYDAALGQLLDAMEKNT